MTDALSTLEGIESASAEADAAIDSTMQGSTASGGDTPTIAPNEATGVKSTWQWSEEMPGAGDPPEWFLQDKYSDVSQQAKAYPDLLKKFGEFGGAPKDGQYKIDKYHDKVDTESQFLKSIMNKAKDMNMTQGGLENMLDLFIEYEEATIPDPEKFISSLKSDQLESAKLLAKWTENNFSPEHAEEISNWMMSPHGLEILNKFRGMSREGRLPKTGPVSTAPSVQDVESLIINNYDKYKKDDSYRARLDQQMHQALAREGLA